MINLEDVVCGTVELCCITLKGVSNILSTLIDITGVDKILRTPLSIAQYN